MKQKELTGLKDKSSKDIRSGDIYFTSGMDKHIPQIDPLKDVIPVRLTTGFKNFYDKLIESISIESGISIDMLCANPPYNVNDSWARKGIIKYEAQLKKDQSTMRGYFIDDQEQISNLITKRFWNWHGEQENPLIGLA